MPQLKKVINTYQLWSIAVGLVISGEYFGWNYGWQTSGTIGFLISTLLVMLSLIILRKKEPNLEDLGMIFFRGMLICLGGYYLKDKANERHKKQNRHRKIGQNFL